ncbi:MAG: exodeoxyribonuclease VII large subunit [Planctomycetia bacterium]|nr:exodeoxyribonuclease VII large subunit [Planctomycetia bacterium]
MAYELENSHDSASERALTVSQFTGMVKDLLEGAFPAVWVVGEISNFSRPSSGHCYFTLKDDGAQMRAVIWRNAAQRLRFDLHDGLEVICHGAVDLYAPRGSYQLVIDQLQPKGIGALELALRKLREKLSAEGLFDPARKRPLPRFPRRIGLITSPTGAAVRDFLQVLKRRWLGADVLLAPVRVQGDGAGKEVAAAIRQLNAIQSDIDVLVVARGGGSLEDLWAFNEEIVVRAIHASRIPVVSAIGHEIDVTLADLVADVRALTPSEAAERVVPSADELRQTLGQHAQRLLTQLRSRATSARLRLESLAARRIFRRPFATLQQSEQRLDELDARAARATRQKLADGRRQISSTAARLESLSPLGVLGRGYSLTFREANGHLIRDAGELQPGDRIRTRLGQGEAVSRVENLL